MNQPPQSDVPSPSREQTIAGDSVSARAKSAYRVPLWRLPPGVSPGTYEYTRRESIARDYAQFLAHTPLVSIDLKIVLDELVPLGPQTLPVIDLGCGDGRALRALIAAGFNGLGVDMSQPMLDEAQSLLSRPTERGPSDSSPGAMAQPLALVRANLVQLQCLVDACASHAICLFSTIGMIKQRLHRQQFMRHVARLVAPGGRFVLHVHNRNDAWRDRASLEAFVASWVRSFRKPDTELGDRVYSYRGLADMFLHTYSLRELKQDLRTTGWQLEKLHCLNSKSDALLDQPGLLPSLRSGGFIAVAKHRA